LKLTFKTHESELTKFKLNKAKLSSLRKKKKNQSKTVRVESSSMEKHPWGTN